MDNVVKFPDAPEWAHVAAKTRDRLIRAGYLKYASRHDWCAVLMAANNAVYDAVLAGAGSADPDLPPLAKYIVRHLKRD
jgi:hypothetical protein